MNIEKFFTSKAQNNSEQIYAKTFTRGFAAMIDASIVLFLRIVFTQIVGLLFINSMLQKFLLEFRDHFGTEFIKNNPEHISFVVHHRIFIIMLLFYSAVIFVGALYHALLNCSSWRATIGKRLMKITIEKENGDPMSFNLGLMHYFLSVLPFIYIFYIISFQLGNNLTFFQAVTFSTTNVFFGLIFVLWGQIQSFTKRKTTAYDLICKTVIINKKTTAKFPWSPSKISNFL